MHSSSAQITDGEVGHGGVIRLQRSRAVTFALLLPSKKVPCIEDGLASTPFTGGDGRSAPSRPTGPR